MGYREKYFTWLNSPYIDAATKEELRKIQGDEKEIEDRFYKELEFGTGGMRGIIGAGSNRINRYTIRKATQGFAQYLRKAAKDAERRGVVIAYDSRHQSSDFAREAALVLCGNGFQAYLFESLRTTPELSFAVRELNCAGGIMITASHNPPEYNGYKVYGEDGGQIVPRFAEKIIQEIDRVRDLSSVAYMEEEEARRQGLLHIIGEEIDRIYIERVKNLAFRKELIRQVGKDLRIVYTPLHGTGTMPVRRVLKELGFQEVMIVPEQEKPDPDFSTVRSPNPEDPKAFELALKLAEEAGADIVVATDPDCDRVGAIVWDKEKKPRLLTGNQTGALLMDYILSTMQEQKRLPKNGAVVKTIVTSELGAEIAQYYGVDILNTLTGFKFIAEKMKEFEETGEKRFLFGYEESYGYLAGTFVRDKDAVIATMLICEMAAYYRSKGMTLYDALMGLYKRHGYYLEDLESVTLAGKEGMERIQRILESFRREVPEQAGGKRIALFRDYQSGKGMHLLTGETEHLDLPKSDVLHFTFEDHSWFCIRPSGTEPKIKVYFSVVEKDMEEAKKRLEAVKADVMARIERIP